MSTPVAILCEALAKRGFLVSVRAMEDALTEAGLTLTGGAKQAVDTHLGRVADLTKGMNANAG
jgi:hypothetical protein